MTTRAATGWFPASLGWFLVLLSLISLRAPDAEAQTARRLVSEEEARLLGLERAWFAQVQLDRARNQVERAVLTGDRLTVLTSSGVVQEFNALTGETLWTARIGNPGYPSLGPAASDRFVALVNGSTLYVLDRNDGRPVIIRPVGGAPGAAPAVAKTHVFVPLVNGRIEGYPLGGKTLTPWYYQSYGRAMVPPLATPTSAVWTTDSGHLYMAQVGSDEEERPSVRFRLETGSEIIASPSYRKPYIYAASLSGEMFAMDESTGARRWKYATGFPVSRSPAAVGDHVFVTSEEPTLHCVNASNGLGVWEAADVAQFAAASRNRVYGVNDFGALIVLDAKNGALLGRMRTGGSTNTLVNDQTDRLYLVSREGTVQCLHEIGAKQPLYHVVPAPATPPQEGTEGQPAETAPSETTAEPPAGVDVAPPTDGEDPFGGDEPETGVELDAEPEAEAEEMPADDAAEDEDPFGAFDS